MKKQNFRSYLSDVAELLGDKIISVAVSDADEEKMSNCGCEELQPFSAWGEKYVYFPSTYDSNDWIAYAPRYPCEEVTNCVGG